MLSLNAATGKTLQLPAGVYVVRSEYQQLVSCVESLNAEFVIEPSRRAAQQLIQAQSPFNKQPRYLVLFYLDPKPAELPLDDLELDDETWVFIWIDALESVRKKVIGGIFQELDLRSFFSVSFPLTELYYAKIGMSPPQFDGIDEKEQHQLWKSLSQSMAQWYQLDTSAYARLFWSNPFLESTLQRMQLWPYAKPFWQASARTLRVDFWDYFAHWVYGASTVWAAPYAHGLIAKTYRGKEYLFFNPSKQAIRQWLKLHEDLNL